MPKFVTWFYPKRIWAFSRSEPYIYLSFDDGPIPEVTPWVLEELKKYNAKATFFCIGENVYKHPKIYAQLLKEGHEVGNHTYHHIKGTETSAQAYLEDAEKAKRIMGGQSHLFRPPYGKLTQAQAKSISSLGYRIVMWDILSYDWDRNISEKRCLANVLKHIKPGSIIVFHDSLKAEKNLRYALPKVLEYILSNGWEARKIPLEN